MFVGYVKMRRRVIIHTRFPNPVYHKTTGVEEDGSGYTIEQDGIMFIPQEYDYTDAQNKVLIDHDVSDFVCTYSLCGFISCLYTVVHVFILFG